MNKRMILIVSVVLVLIIAGIVIAQSGTLNNAERQLKLGYKLLDEGKYEEAILAFQKVIEIEPRNTKAYAGLGLAQANTGDYDTAFAAVGDALGMGLDSYELLHEAMVNIYLLKGDENGAVFYIQSINDQWVVDYLMSTFSYLFENTVTSAYQVPQVPESSNEEDPVSSGEYVILPDNALELITSERIYRDSNGPTTRGVFVAWNLQAFPADIRARATAAYTMTFDIGEDAEFNYDEEIVKLHEEAWKEELAGKHYEQDFSMAITHLFPVEPDEESMPAKIVFAVIDKDINIIALYLLSIPGI